MTATGFQRALPRVLAHEGGYVDHPKDPGGATNKGVTFRVYNAYRLRKGLPVRDVREITSEEVFEIYRLQYWDAVKGDELPPGVDYVLFDGAVNSGPSRSIRWLQMALGVEADGSMGVVTLNACTSFPDKVRLVDLICDQRMTYLRELKTWGTFGKGWTARVSGVRAVGKVWANGAGATPVIPAQPTPKAKPPVEKPKPSFFDLFAFWR